MDTRIGSDNMLFELFILEIMVQKLAGVGSTSLYPPRGNLISSLKY